MIEVKEIQIHVVIKVRSLKFPQVLFFLLQYFYFRNSAFSFCHIFYWLLYLTNVISSIPIYFSFSFLKSFSRQFIYDFGLVCGPLIVGSLSERTSLTTACTFMAAIGFIGLVSVNI